MRSLATHLLLAALALAQTKAVPQPPSPSNEKNGGEETLTIPAGTKIPVALKHAISTKSAREGDAVYAQTTFPFVLNDRILVPAGTYIQGKISRVQRGGRVHGHAEMLIHFTTLIYPSRYTVMLPGSVENVPGAERTSMKGDEGTIRQDSQTAQKVGTVATTTGTGAVLGRVVSGTGKGAGIGAGIGGAAGTAIALLTRGKDVRLDAGTTIEMLVQRPITLDANRIGRTGR